VVLSKLKILEAAKTLADKAGLTDKASQIARYIQDKFCAHLPKTLGLAHLYFLKNLTSETAHGRCRSVQGK